MISGFQLLLRILSPLDFSMFQHVWTIFSTCFFFIPRFAPRQVLQKASAVLTRDPTLAAIAFEAEEEEAPPQKPAPKAYPTPAPAAGTAPAPPPVVSKAPVVSTAPARPGLGAATPAPKTGIFGSSPAPGGRNPLFEDTKRGDKLFDWWPRGFHKLVSLVEVSLKKVDGRESWYSQWANLQSKSRRRRGGSSISQEGKKQGAFLNQWWQKAATAGWYFQMLSNAIGLCDKFPLRLYIQTQYYIYIYLQFLHIIV